MKNNQKRLSANLLDFLLTNNQFIPEEWKKRGKKIFFLTTQYQYEGKPYYRYLYWDDVDCDMPAMWRWSATPVENIVFQLALPVVSRGEK